MRPSEAEPPWLTGEPKPPTSQYAEWRYTVQVGYHDTNELARRVAAIIGHSTDNEEITERRFNGRVFDLQFDAQGLPVPDTLSLSLGAWAAGCLLANPHDGLTAIEARDTGQCKGLPTPSNDVPDPNTGIPAFDSLHKHLVESLRQIVAKSEVTCFSRQQIDTMSARLFERLRLPSDLVEPVGHVVVCQPVKRNRNEPTSPDLLNSFFVRDLSALSAQQPQDLGRGLRDYLISVTTPPERTDIRTAEGRARTLASLHPARTPRGRWPAENPLVYSQQVAVNETWQHLADGSGLSAVNGPPGTGKTTLLRDMVAGVVSRRAESIAALDKPAQAFGNREKTTCGNKPLPYYPLAQGVRGHSMIIASANNTAVENVSLELPAIDALPEGRRPSSDYFSGLAGRLLDAPSWGLIAARLGRKDNRSRFIETLWWAEPDETTQKDATAPEAGLRHHLQALIDGRRTPAMGWTDARERFREALADEASLREKLLHAARQHDERERLIGERERAQADIEARYAAVQNAEATCHTAEADYRSAQQDHAKRVERQKRYQQALETHRAAKPGILEWLASWGRSHRDWRKRFAEYQDQLYEAIAAVDTAEQSLATATAHHEACQRARDQAYADYQATQAYAERTRERLDAVAAEVATLRDWLGEHAPPDANSSDKAIETSSPYAIPAWREARENVFLAALDLQRALIESNPKAMMANLNLANDWLKGQAMPAAMAETAFETLCLVVPLVSTTFASVASMLNNIRCEQVGWLLIDEGGQAPPHYAAGAIHRAQRTLVVGDPNQLEPVAPFPPSLADALGLAYGLPHDLWPNQTSTQYLADQAMPVGTTLRGQGDTTHWIGSPLRVHRRCDEPMFSLSNRIAYDGLMVHATPHKPCDLPRSQWLDVTSTANNGHWIPAEGEVARHWIATLFANNAVDAKDLFVISPFRDAARALTRHAAQWGLRGDLTGTVHTAQGKEADVVILVLGGDPQRPGAKTWVAEKPNLINVALTRARRRIYVIGNHATWAQKPNFGLVADTLPVVTPSLETNA